MATELVSREVDLSIQYPPANRGKIVVWGLMANSPFGGMIWQVYQYIVPLRKLGFDVWYVEESDEFIYDPVTYHPTNDYETNVRFLNGYMKSVGMEDRWIFRPPQRDYCVGARDVAGLNQLYRDADVAINLCGAQEPRANHETIRCRVYVETDPVQNQVDVASGDRDRIEELACYDHLFTYGENLGDDDCLVPIERFKWNKTRPPVCIEWWATGKPPGPDAALTSIANWKHKGKDVVWQGQAWRWSKHHEFLKFIDLPLHARLPMELSVGAIGPEDCQKLKDNGWRTRPSGMLEHPDAYRRYIQQSLGEFTVAKEQYVKPRSGWFSDRSVCYLASGRPVVTQDTAFGKRIPSGRGLFAYRDHGEALAAIDTIASDYEKQSAAALEIAREYFEAQKVVGGMLGTIGLL